MDFEVIHQHGNSGSSSSEELNDHHHHDQANEKFINENAVLGRFYECMFCKRGFTNAQALGGHMNIHRKEKAKAKMQKGRQCLVSSKSASEELLVIDQRYCDNFLLGDQQNHHQYYEVPVGGQMSYQYFFPGSNPNFSHQEYDHDLCDFVDHDPKKEINHRDPNLMSMQIGPARQNGETKNDQTWKDQSEVDLELRLGLAL